MTIDPKIVQVLRRHIGELDTILDAAQGDLNAVRGSERVAKWKAQTVTVLAQCLGPDAARRFSAIKPGPSFTQDLLEELADEAELYRHALATLIEGLNKRT